MTHFHKIPPLRGCLEGPKTTHFHKISPLRGCLEGPKTTHFHKIFPLRGWLEEPKQFPARLSENQSRAGPTRAAPQRARPPRWRPSSRASLYVVGNLLTSFPKLCLLGLQLLPCPHDPRRVFRTHLPGFPGQPCHVILVK